MKFGPLPPGEALGAILAHGLRLADGTLKKGRVLTAADVARLEAAGVAEVVAARLEPGDMGEDEAAARVARALAGGPVTVAEAFTGRANLFAAGDGLVEVARDRLVALNRVDEGLTVATVADREPVRAGQMLATVKIIPFALPRAVVARAVALCADGGPMLCVAPYLAKAAGLVLTRFDWTADKLLDKRKRAIADRLEAAGCRLAGVETCAHREADIAAAVAKLAADGADPILVFGAAAIGDRDDVVPRGIVGAGGDIVHLGMPVDPGNLLLVARLGSANVIGVPSCAGSPQFNGFDMVLGRALAGLPVGSAEIAAMAPGGLLKDTGARPQPRRAPEPAEARRRPRVAALILAAGSAARMGRNKLMETLAGAPLLRHVATAVLASAARPVMVVTGHEAERVREALGDLDVTFVHNRDHAAGLSASLKAGLRALPNDIDGTLVCLGDMPGVEAAHLDRLIAAFAPKEGRAICVPVRHGKRGNPVLWASGFFEEMLAVRGDTGAKHLIGEHEDQLCEVEIDSDAIFGDVDTPADLARLRSGLVLSRPKP